MDDLCRSIPQPSNSKFIGKARMFKSVVGLSFYYTTSKSNPELKEHFQEYFAQVDWQSVNPDRNDLAYEKSGTEVKVHFTRDSSVSYTVYCGKISDSSGQYGKLPLLRSPSKKSPFGSGRTWDSVVRKRASLLCMSVNY